jgi:DNA-binding XRE family transcriptional regulator
MRLKFNWLKTERINKGWTQRDLANIVHVSRATISDIETGKVNPLPIVKKGICDALGIDIDEWKNL